MGAFTTLPTVVQHLHATGILVWFIRQDSTFDKQEMEQVMTSPRQPSNIETGLYMSDSPALWRGLSDGRHLHLICRSQHQYVDVSIAPLLYRYDAAANCADNRPASISSAASLSSHASQNSGPARHAPCKLRPASECSGPSLTSLVNRPKSSTSSQSNTGTRQVHRS